MLDGYGLHQLTWDTCDERFGDVLVASPADAGGRGISLAVREDGSAADLTGAAVYLVWKHKVTGERGTEPFTAVNASAGTFEVYYPAAMQEAEGAVQAQVMVSRRDDTYISSRVFTIRVEPVVVGGEEHEDGFTLFVDARRDGRDARRVRERRPLGRQEGPHLQALHRLSRPEGRGGPHSAPVCHHVMGEGVLPRARGRRRLPRRQRGARPPRPRRRQQHQPRDRGRLRDPDPRALKRALQRVSAEHGLSALADHESVPWQRRRIGRAEREIMAKGEYSWVADIRERVAVARGTARTERDFVALLGRMGVVVEPSKSREGDWVYSLAATPTRRVTGTKLGSGYTRSGVSSAMRTAMRSASPEAAERIVRLANGAIEVRDLRELGELARAVGFVSRNNVRSLAEMDRAISHSRDGSKTARLEALRESCERYGLLPQTAPKPTVGRKPNPGHDNGRRRPYDEGSHQRHHEQSTPSRGREL